MLGSLPISERGDRRTAERPDVIAGLGGGERGIVGGEVQAHRHSRPHLVGAGAAVVAIQLGVSW